MKIILIILTFIILIVLYIILIRRVRNINVKLFKYKKEEQLKQNNVLIIYQPSRHKTTYKIVEKIKEVLSENEYGYLIHTLDNKLEDYSKYKKVVFVAPVYFGEVHIEFIKKVMTHKFNNLSIVYNGLNEDSNKEDEYIKKYVSRYSKIKLHTKDIEKVKNFVKKEGRRENE